jgi:hypothetical protein
MVEHREIAFESAVEHSLTNHLRRLRESRSRPLRPHLRASSPAGSRLRQDHSPQIIALPIAACYGKNADDAFLNELALALDSRGTIDVLRHDLDFSVRPSTRLTSHPPADSILKLRGYLLDRNILIALTDVD